MTKLKAFAVRHAGKGQPIQLVVYDSDYQEEPIEISRKDAAWLAAQLAQAVAIES